MHAYTHVDVHAYIRKVQKTNQHSNNPQGPASTSIRLSVLSPCRCTCRATTVSTTVRAWAR